MPQNTTEDKLNDCLNYVNQVNDSPWKWTIGRVKWTITRESEGRKRAEKRKNGRRKSRAAVKQIEFLREKCEEKAGFLQIPRIFT